VVLAEDLKAQVVLTTERRDFGHLPHRRQEEVHDPPVTCARGDGDRTSRRASNRSAGSANSALSQIDVACRAGPHQRERLVIDHGRSASHYRSNFEFSTNTDPENPPPGKVFSYLYKFCNGTSTCSYGQTSAGLERTPGSGSCP